MTKENIKKFWETHKVKLVGGTALIGGTVIGGLVCNKMNATDRAFMDMIKSFGNSAKEKAEILDEIYIAQKDAIHMGIHMMDKCNDITLDNIGELLKQYHESKGIDMNTQVTGLVLFDKRTK